jgi:hypothetical protein
VLHRFSLVTRALTILLAAASGATAQIDVYNNQGFTGFPTAIGFVPSVTMWDDLQLVQGGLLSEISFIAEPPAVLGNTASGIIDLRVFDEVLNRPQGTPLGMIPFSGTFERDPTDVFDQRLIIEVANLEPLGIHLPNSGRIGAGIFFDDEDWFFPDAGPPELGTSPGGNWLNSSSFERNDVDGLAWRVAIAEPEPSGPGVGTYTIFETALATPNHPTSNGGTGADANFYTGVGFRVERDTQLKQVGAWIGGSGTIFAAIVDLGANQFGLPNPPDLSGSDVLGTTLIDLDGTDFTGEEVVADFELTLEPGAYALLFGAGRFGADADADGFLRDAHIPNGDWSEYSIRQSDGMRFFQAGTPRIFAIADSAPGTVQVRPTFDLLAEVTRDDISGDVENVRLIDGDPTITVDKPVTSDDPDQLAVFEFSLADVPADRDVLSVLLELDLNFANTSPPTQFEIFGFAGDGASGRQDAVGQQTVVGVTNITDIGLVEINIDTAFVAGLVGTASHLGLTIAPEDIGAFRFNTLEGGETGEAPLLTIVLGPPPATGDYNDDGIVNAADYVVWRNSVGHMGVGLAADGDGDGEINDGDYSLWRMHFGEAVGSSGSTVDSAAVPEPLGQSMLLVAIITITGGTTRLIRRARSAGA